MLLTWRIEMRQGRLNDLSQHAPATTVDRRVADVVAWLKCVNRPPSVSEITRLRRNARVRSMMIASPATERSERDDENTARAEELITGSS